MAQKKGVTLDDTNTHVALKPRIKGDKAGSKKKASKKPAR